MRRIFSQVIILILFLFLTIFAAVWFEDTGGEERDADNKRASVRWLVVAGQNTWSLIDALLKLSEPTDYNDPDLLSDQPYSGSDIASIVQSMSPTASSQNDNLSSLADTALASENSDFREFLNSFFDRAPALYLDTKIYSNGWRNFASLYWLEYQSLLQE